MLHPMGGMDETVLMSDRQSRQGGIALQRIFFF
jgi:hypothetical protein